MLQSHHQNAGPLLSDNEAVIVKVGSLSLIKVEMLFFLILSTCHAVIISLSQKISNTFVILVDVSLL